MWHSSLSSHTSGRCHRPTPGKWELARCRNLFLPSNSLSCALFVYFFILFTLYILLFFLHAPSWLLFLFLLITDFSSSYFFPVIDLWFLSFPFFPIYYFSPHFCLFLTLSVSLWVFLMSSFSPSLTLIHSPPQRAHRQDCQGHTGGRQACCSQVLHTLGPAQDLQDRCCLPSFQRPRDHFRPGEVSFFISCPWSLYSQGFLMHFPLFHTIGRQV